MDDLDPPTFRFRRLGRDAERREPEPDPDASLAELNQAKDKVMEAIAGLVAEAREGWSPPEWYRRPKAAGRP